MLSHGLSLKYLAFTTFLLYTSVAFPIPKIKRSQSQMEFDVIYAGSFEALLAEAEEKVNAGWKIQGDAAVVKPESEGSDVPEFIYYYQVITRTDGEPLPDESSVEIEMPEWKARLIRQAVEWGL